MSIRVTLTGLSEKVRVSADHTFAQSSGVGNDRDLRQAGLAFVDFWDHYPLSTREFAFVCAEVIAAGGGFRSGERALIPFELVKFTHHGNEALK